MGFATPRRRQALEAQILRATTQTRPSAATHWSTRTLARHLRTNPILVQRVWHAHGLKPHLVRTFKFSRDPQFVETLTDVVGLYLNPPDKTLVWQGVTQMSPVMVIEKAPPH